MKGIEQGQSLKTLLARNIKRQRSVSGLTVEELAEKAVISVPYLGSLERGLKWPGPGTLERIAHGLGIIAGDLLMPEDIVQQNVKKLTAEMVKNIESVMQDTAKKLRSELKNR